MGEIGARLSTRLARASLLAYWQAPACRTAEEAQLIEVLSALYQHPAHLSKSSTARILVQGVAEMAGSEHTFHSSIDTNIGTCIS